MLQLSDPTEYRRLQTSYSIINSLKLVHAKLNKINRAQSQMITTEIELMVEDRETACVHPLPRSPQQILPRVVSACANLIARQVYAFLQLGRTADRDRVGYH